MDGVQLTQGCKATTRRQLTFYHKVSRNSWYSSDQTCKNESSQSTLEPPSGFEHGTPRLGIQRLNHYAIAQILF